MDSESPPRKKLKQARLPFQILSHKEASSESSPSTTSRKRPLSEGSQDDDIVVVKVGKTSEEVKENGKEAPILVEDKETEPVNEEGLAQDAVETTESKPEKESPQADKENSKSQEGSILQSQMKSTLANLFGKKVFDVTADVGSCDCGCEEANSDEEALAEYQEQCNKSKVSPSKSGKKPKVKSKKKTENPHGSCASEESSGTRKSKESTKNSIDSIVDVNPDVKQEKTENSSLLSQKAHSMFAKWRKDPTDSNQSGDSIANDKKKKLDSEEILPLSVKKEAASPKARRKDLKSSPKSSKVKNEIVTKSELDVNEDSKSVKDPIDDLKKEKVSKKENLDSDGGTEEVKVALSIDLKEEPSPARKRKDVEYNAELSIGVNPRTPSGKKEKLGGTESPIILDQDKSSFPVTPTSLGKTPQRRLTPKQLERQRESAKKQEEKERQKLERENEKKRLKQEKEDLKKKEKEEKEEQRRKDKEEKEKKKQAEQEQKNEEKKKKELLKVEEKRRKEEDKRKAEEEEERKKAKASAMFTSFFVPKTVKPDREDAPQAAQTAQNFMPFEIKADMRVAPRVRLILSSPQKKTLEKVIESTNDKPTDSLYLHALKSGQISPKVSSKTWPVGETKEDDDICVLEFDDGGVLVKEQKKVERMRAKFLQFHENHRPAYRGTWRKKSTAVTGRRPFGQEKILDYEIESADEWEEEEPGESLHGSDDEKEQESEDEYEVDNTVFVPHGYLSEDEGDDDENMEMSPETQKAKLKLLGEEFEAQMKSKTSALKPIIIVLTAALQASSISSVRYQKLFERRAVWREDEGPIVLSDLSHENDSSEGLSLMASDPNCVTFSTGPGAKKKIISEEAIPALILLVHGNQNKRIFLTNEFSAFLAKSQSFPGGDANDCANSGPSDNVGTPSRPTTPSSNVANPLVQKWPGLPKASRISISNKIKEIASWGACPEEGPMHHRMCWYVAEEIREKYKVNDLKLPNTVWHYTLKPKVFSHSHSPSASANSSSGNGVDSRALITKFTKVMTPEEKQRQWGTMKTPGSQTSSTSKMTNSKSSAGKITAFTQQVKIPEGTDSKAMHSRSVNGTPSTSSQPQAKKRVPLLVSVPRGQQISNSPSHCSLLAKFNASASSNETNVVPSTESAATSNTQGADDCIVLD